MSPEKHGTQRTELSVGLLDEAIAEDAFVRVIDLFVDRLGDLTRLGFMTGPDRSGEKGDAPAYSGSALLKCYVYRYYYGFILFIFVLCCAMLCRVIAPGKLSP